MPRKTPNRPMKSPSKRSHDIFKSRYTTLNRRKGAGGKCEEMWFELNPPEDPEAPNWGGDPIVLGTLHVPAKPCKVLLGNEGRPLIRDKEQ